MTVNGSDSDLGLRYDKSGAPLDNGGLDALFESSPDLVDRN